MNVYAREPFDTIDELTAQDPWRGFLPGSWTREIDVRSFIIANVTPYEGDARFLAGITPRTADLWEKLKVQLKAERDKGGVLVLLGVGIWVLIDAILMFTGSVPDSRGLKLRS